MYPDHLREYAESYLRELRFSGDGRAAGLERAMRYSLLAGGKRIRPVLALATAEAIGVEPRAVLPLAAALELIHTYSLIHDDLPAMDDDVLRRGRPTCHVEFGVDVAILAGDALYAEAFGHLLAAQQPLAAAGPGAVLACARELADATGVGGMVGGQFLDVTGQAAGGPELAALHALKTGRLIGAAIVCVLLLAGRDPDALGPWPSLAAELGLLFQIVDDIIDVTSSDAELGKPQGSDERHGKQTYVTLYGLDGARERARTCHDAARSTLEACAPEHGESLRAITGFLLTRSS